MKTFTAKEMKNRLGQVFNSVAGAPVEITKNGSVYAYMLSADAFWKLTGGCKLSDQAQRDVLIDMQNGEISTADTMKTLCVTNRNELNKLSTKLGVGVRDKLLAEKNDKRNAFFSDIANGIASSSDAILYKEVAVKCRGKAKFRSSEY
jgi:antitoxin (DNA-binding transcriptional repressor) of toxin-antitoxin stability system